MKRGLKVLLFFTFLSVLSSCVGKKKMIYLQDKSAKGSDRYYAEKTLGFICNSDGIKIGDELFIEVKKIAQPNLILGTDLSNGNGVVQLFHPYQAGFTVDSSGSVTLPIFGAVELIGLQLVEAELKIKRLVEESYPSASAKVLYLNHFVSFVGQVAKPGRINFYDNLNILEGVAQAGDLLEYADRSNVIVIRSVNGVEKRISLDLTDYTSAQVQSFCLENRDLVIIAPLKRRVLANNNFQWILGSLTTLVSLTSLVITIANR